MKRVLGVCSLVAALLTMPGTAHGQSADNVLVVANAASSASVEIAQYYAAARHIPIDQILQLRLPTDEQVQRSDYLKLLELPIAHWLGSHSAQDRILYIVLVKGVPLRIAGTPGRTGTFASVDSELALLYRKLSGAPVLISGMIDNPYFAGDRAPGDAPRFTHREHDIYLVARLDGFTVADVKGLIDRAAAPSRSGVIVLDERQDSPKSIGNSWLAKAAGNLKGIATWETRIVHDSSSSMVRNYTDVVGYYSWGSNDPAAPTSRDLNVSFVPGAIGATFANSDARTFQAPPDDWQPRQSDFAGSSQSLIGDFIRQGITGVAGHVAEPYLGGTIRPDVLFAAYLSGVNLIESFYLATPVLSWQTVVVGDPLTAPFARQALTAREIDPGRDPISELPTFFTGHRVRVLAAAGVGEEAGKLAMKSEVRLARDDRTGAREALEEATVIDEGFVAAHLALAALNEGLRNWDAAIDRYRRVLARSPADPIALNNLAYALAEHKKAPSEALPLARRAYAASQSSPTIADTLGWIHHLLGNHAEAERLLEGAAKSSPNNAVIHYHWALALAATGKTEAARRALRLASGVDSSIELRDDIQKLRAQLGVSAQ